MNAWFVDEKFNRRPRPFTRRGRGLRHSVIVACRVWGPGALVWLASLLAYERFSEALPRWAHDLLYSVVMIGAVIPFLGMFTWPIAIYAAIRLRSEWRLALPCVLFAVFGALIVLAGLATPFDAIGDMFAWPALGMAAIAATWAGYSRTHNKSLEENAAAAR